jgi:hypothetical protein
MCSTNGNDFDSVGSFPWLLTGHVEKYRVFQQKPDVFLENILYIKLDRQPNKAISKFEGL